MTARESEVCRGHRTAEEKPGHGRGEGEAVWNAMQALQGSFSKLDMQIRINRNYISS